ncbi:helix-turn-helix transcriptional regulator [Brevibacillus sp. SYP-B805]|uniref:helix-turn-helix transcriptional regulator n=1 Tax=Brevibacillus sp. SYP-B805 TaxID=1578199 RepID=UPI0013ED67E3|nr:helix-turn-helix transcriptional regulator [Brevibacillus sp. SYP-B805]NGQ95053.1 helix-turn-helix transcriptional regulator [Brevibacillus sp. SYP-B805]
MKKRTVLIALRKEQGWSQKTVAEKLRDEYGISITVSYYGMIEQGVRTPKLDLALAIAKLFKREPAEIFFEQSHNKMLCNSIEDQQSA